jgi:hypothetical protein
LTDVNGNPASHASLFHAITETLSSYGWAVFVALAALRIAYRRQTSGKRFATTELAS